MAKFTAESVVDHAPVALFLETGKWIRIDGWNWDFDGIALPRPPPTRGQLPAGNVELKLVKSARDERAGETEKQVARM